MNQQEMVSKLKDKNSIPYSVFLSIYMNEMIRVLKRIHPELNDNELENLVRYGIIKDMTVSDVEILNNYTNQKGKMDLLSLLDQILVKRPIMTTPGVLFKRHGVCDNWYARFVNYLLDTRNATREIRKRCVKGTHEFKTYENKELNYKVSCNAVYGCSANDRSTFYNPYVCLSTTGQGRGCISAALTMFESFLSNNIKFGSLTEVLQFIDNIDGDCYNTQYKDSLYLDKRVSPEEVYLKLLNTCGYDGYVPTDDDLQVIWNTVNNISQRTLERVYYKNNLYKFCDNKPILNRIVNILTTLTKPFTSPIDIPDEIKDPLNELKDLFHEYVFYNHIYLDKLPRIYKLKRSSVLLTDTDSCVVCVDQWVKYVSSKIKGIDMKIRYTKEDIEKAIQKYQEYRSKTDYGVDYDFKTDQLVPAKHKKTIMYFIEEESVSYSIVNIMSYIIGELNKEYMKTLTYNYHCEENGKDTRLLMKNEYLMLSVLLTKGGKNYSTLQALKDGFPVPESKQFDVKGMPITKVGIPDSTKKALQDILQYDILRNDDISQADLFKKFVILEKMIRDSLKNKETKYYKVARIKALNNYQDPMRIQGIKASYAYNQIKSDSEPTIDLETRNTVLIIKTDINKKNVDSVLVEFPQYCYRMKKLLDDKSYKGSIDAIAIPVDLNVPNWIIPFINYNSIVQDNLKAFPLDELRMSKSDSKTITHSNLLRFF